MKATTESLDSLRSFVGKKRPSRARGERGYVLITLMLFVALIGIALMATYSTASFQARRDREEELVHRGVQYARAVRAFFKKNGRYPTRIEELENTNNLRFLRKRYKDPITGEDFKLLRMGDVKLTFGQGIAGAMTPAAMNAQQGAGAGLAAAGLPTQATPPGTTPPGGTQPAAGGDGSGGEGTEAKPDPDSQSGFSGPVFGGGPIVGVASRSTKDSIREFNKKNRYDQWQFIYDPTSDRGGLLNTPAQPPLQGATGITGNGPQPGGMSPNAPIPSPVAPPNTDTTPQN